jgi:hypothetical protein
MTEISPASWLTHLYGKTETQLLTSETTPEPLHGISAGVFNTWTIKQLTEQVASTSKETTSWPLFVIHVRQHGGGVSDNRLFDTSSLQVNAVLTLPRPLFQVASNFNAQENGSESTNLYDGEYLTDLMSDKTQGPAASAGAGAGAVARLWQHQQRKINLLERVDGLLSSNGKLVHIEPQKRFASADVEQVALGLHTDVSACFERAALGQCRFLSGQVAPLIDQVFTSTVCLPLFKKKEHARVKEVAKMLLKCAYDGTYMVALLRNSATLVLTLIGGGVFRNDTRDIVDALGSAHATYAGKGSSLKTVLLPLYESHENASHIATLVESALIKAGVPAETIKIRLC